METELDTETVGERRDALLERALASAAGVAETKVGEAMSTDPLIVAPEDTLGEVAEHMCERQVDSAAVAEYGRLVGIVTSCDMLRAIASRVHSSEARVRQWMTAAPITVSAATTLDIADALMAEHGIHHLPVVEAERPVGLLEARDAVPGLRIRVP